MIDPRIGRRTSGLQGFSRHLLASAAVVGLVLGQAAYANPLGGTVSSGKATISTPASGTLQIDQTTKIVIINWNSFNIAGGETTKFVQPNASSIAVNRIGGSDPSTILGSLLANGKVVLINGNGILFGPGSKINVGSLLATTSDASDADIASGKAKFDKAGNPNAQIINQGNITAASGGMVGLIAPAVSNSGTITAKLGSVTLGASNVFTVDFTGDGLVSFPVDGNVVAAAIGKNGKPVEALVVNDGKISGGTVVLSARAAANLVTNVISMKGEIVATSAHEAGGKIVLDGGNSGDIAVAGSLDASGTSGGSISVVSQGTTSISGTVTAKNTTGKGGSIETSGHNLSIAGSVNAGQGGSWLVDPYDLTVDASAATTINSTLGAGTGVTLTTAAGSASGPGTQNASGNGDIIINSAISWSTAAAFTLSAYRDIDINANVTASGGGALSLTTGTGTSGDYIIASGKSISFTGGSGAGASLSINGTAYTLLYSMADVQNINASSAALQGRYAMAGSLDASSVSNWIPIGTDGANNVGNSGNGFSGVFTGLGHTISNLMVGKFSDSSTHCVDIGPFGYSSGTIRDIGMVGGSVSGSDYVGGLVGWNSGTITNAYATGTVSGIWLGDWFTGNYLGGLVGANYGTISNTYATGAVTGRYGFGGLAGTNSGTIIDSYATGKVSYQSGDFDVTKPDNDSIGGLVGTNNGVITSSYATGMVNVSNGSDIGGLVGWNGGTITNAYATGVVSSVGGGNLVGSNDFGGTISNSYATGRVFSGGGLVGANGGTITNGYWDTETSGYNNTSSSGTGKTTAGLQGTLPSGFDNTVWGTGSGLYPYFLWQYPTTPQAISGFAYSDAGVTALRLTTVSALVNGTNLGNATTGANGYYYLLAPHGTFSGSQQLLTYLSGGTVKANTYVQSPTGSVTNANLYGGYLRVLSGAATTSAMFGGLSTALGSYTGSDFLYAGGSLVSGVSLDVESSNGAGFAIDSALNLGAGTLILRSAGTITESGAGTITAGRLSISSYGAVTLNAANAITNLGTLTTNGNYALALTDARDLTVAGLVNVGTADLTLTTTGSGHDIVVNSTLKGGTVKLTSAATISSNSSGKITATTLTGSSHGTVALTAANVITNLGAFTTNGNYAFVFSDAHGVTVTGAVNTGTGTVNLVTKGTGNGIAESGVGRITAGVLTGSSYGAVTLNAANVITDLGVFTTIGNNAFALTDAHDLTVTGAVNTGTAGLTLTTIGTGDDIIVANRLHGGTIKLVSAATISSNSSGKISATTLTGSSHGALTLNAANTIANLGTFTTSGNNAFMLTDAHDLTVTGAVNAGTAVLTLTTSGTGNDIIVDNTLHGGTVKLVSAATISSNSSGILIAATLTGSSVGNTTLNAANKITNLGNFNVSAGDLSFNSAQTLNVTGTVKTTASVATLNLQTTSGDLHVTGTAMLAAPTVTLNSAGEALEDATGQITTNLINVTAITGIDLIGAANNITAIGTNHTISGPDIIQQ